MTTLADRTIDALRSNHDDLAARVRGYDDTDLAQPSGASGWEVAQVLSHLGSGAEIGLAGLRSGLAGQDAPGDEFNRSVWDRWNAMGRREQADGFLRANEDLVAAFEGLDAAARQELRVKLGFMPFPADVAMLAGLRIGEASLHGWDVRVAADPQATLSAEEAAVSLEHSTGGLSFLMGFLGRPGALAGVPVTVRVETSEPARVLALVLSEQTTLTDGAPAAAAAVLRLPAEAWLRLVAGRLDAAHTPDAVSVTSDVLTLDQLRAAFPGY